MRYKLGTSEGLLSIEEIESGPFPLRAYGFLQFSPKDHPNGELMLEVRGEEIWVWVAEKPKDWKNGKVDDKGAQGAPEK